MRALYTAALAARFALELAALAALSYWGFTLDAHAAVRIALGIGAPLASAVAWGAFVAPNAAITVSAPVRLTIELAVFAAATVALIHAGAFTAGVALAGTYIVDRLTLALAAPSR